MMVGLLLHLCYSWRDSFAKFFGPEFATSNWCGRRYRAVLMMVFSPILIVTEERQGKHLLKAVVAARGVTFKWHGCLNEWWRASYRRDGPHCFARQAFFEVWCSPTLFVVPAPQQEARTFLTYSAVLQEYHHIVSTIPLPQAQDSQTIDACAAGIRPEPMISCAAFL
jgi:hypothetical protein